MMRRFGAYCLLSATAVLLLLGCAKKEENEITGRCIYYVNEEKTGLTKVAYEPEIADAGKEVEDILDKMKETPESLEYQASIPEDVEIRGIGGLDSQFKELVLDFSSNYSEMDPVTEVLMREAVVRTMVQVEGVDVVSFTVDKIPLQDKYDNLVGEMNADSFLKNTGSAIHSYKKTTLTLYFGNETGDRLKREENSARYNSNIPIEKLILEQLQKGPADKSMKATLPKEVKILSVSLKDGICYLNLDENFLNATYTVQPDIVIASIVNSIIDAGNAAQVQISVNGENDMAFQGTIPLDMPFTRNLDIVEP